MPDFSKLTKEMVDAYDLPKLPQGWHWTVGPGCLTVGSGTRSTDPNHFMNPWVEIDFGSSNVDVNCTDAEGLYATINANIMLIFINTLHDILKSNETSA